jgi:hypothetical protein
MYPVPSKISAWIISKPTKIIGCKKFREELSLEMDRKERLVKKVSKETTKSTLILNGHVIIAIDFWSEKQNMDIPKKLFSSLKLEFVWFHS